MGTRFGVLVVVYVVPCGWGDWLMAFRAQARVWWDGDVGTLFFWRNVMHTAYTIWLFNIAMENPNHKWRY